MTDRRRLIEVAFPLKQASIDSLHEKSAGRAGHISTLHIWPARRPLAASRAALIATLLSDLEDDGERKAVLERLAGTVVEKRTPGEVLATQTVGGILHWGRESGPDLDWFREQIRTAYGGRAPRVLDPFAGGGAIPLEAMRLGCETVAIDINPVAWFILRCTLHYPRQLAGKKLPLPAFALTSPPFRKAWEEARTRSGKKATTRRKQGTADLFGERTPEAEAYWHVRAWGEWVLDGARKELASVYPSTGDGETLAYLWARAVTCKNCRGEVPLLKTRWLCKTKKGDRRVLLKVQPRAGGRVEFEVDSDVPVVGATSTQKKEHDKRIGAGTMSESGARCPACPTIMTMDDIKLEALAGRLQNRLVAVVVAGLNDGGRRTRKDYRAPLQADHEAASVSDQVVRSTFADLPFGKPSEPTPKSGKGTSRAGGGSAFSVDAYGLDEWGKLFAPRQLLALGTFAHRTRAAWTAMGDAGYSDDWREAIVGYLACMFDRLANQSSTIAHWNKGGQNIEGTFARFALPMVWDFAEVNPIGTASGSYEGAIDWVTKVVTHLCAAEHGAQPACVIQQSATSLEVPLVDVVLTDPPYYDAIPYAALMDFFYVWLRRTMYGLSAEIDAAFDAPLSPKWDEAAADGELIDDASRFDGDKTRSKTAYEDGMARAFRSCHRALAPDGRLVIVFAHKDPNAWEALVSAIIRAGCVVDASWPIQTERSGRTRSLSSSALSSSVWLVCRKRPDAARPGWDNHVLREMDEKIHRRLHSFWDAGIRGPDFVWAATGPALEAYSKHPVVKKANEPGKVMEVGEFLRHVRRIVVDFVVGRVLTRDGGAESVAGLDDVTTYYLLHRHDFGTGQAPSGACILYAVSCGLSDRDLTDQWDLLLMGAGAGAVEEDFDDDGDDEDDDGEESAVGSGGKVRLKAWDHRRRKSMGYDAEGRPAPLVDQVHRLMHLWRAGDASKVDEYLDTRALRKNQLFHQLLQALIELAVEGTDERALLESISNHVSPRTQTVDKRQVALPIATASEP